MNDKRPTAINLVTKAIDLVGITRLTKACGLASRNAIRTWEKTGRIPIDAETDYAGIISAETSGAVSRADIWLTHLADLKPGVVYRVPVSLLRRDEHQPRRVFDDERLNELAAAMATDGQETPIKFTVDGTPISTRPLIIKHGERRWRAVQIGGIDYLEGILDDKADEAARERTFRQITDNMGAPLRAWDWACTFKQLNHDGMTDQEIADDLAKRGIKGYSRPVVSNYRRLFQLPLQIQRLIESDWLTPSHGKQILLQAKHTDIIEYLCVTLNDMKAREMKPCLTDIDVTIQELYASHYPYVDGNLNTDNEYPYTCNFDYAVACAGCEHKHTTKLSNGHEESFCTQPACYVQKTEAAKAAMEEDARPDRTPDHEPGIDEHPDPINFADDEEPPLTENQKRGRKIAEATRGFAPDKDGVMAAIGEATEENVDLILAYCSLLEDEIDDESVTLKAIAVRLRHDRLSMKRTAAKSGVLNYLTQQHIKEIGEYLGVAEASAAAAQPVPFCEEE